MRDLGLALIRVPTGALLAGHGAQKVFGWFGGDGPDETGKHFESLGYPRGREMALLAGATEMAAGAGIAAGLMTPLAAAGVIGTMTNAAVAVHGDKGLWTQHGGYEYPLVMGAVAAGLATQGPGRLSLDALFGRAESGVGRGLAAVGLGLGAAAAALGTRRKPLGQ